MRHFYWNSQNCFWTPLHNRADKVMLRIKLTLCITKSKSHTLPPKRNVQICHNPICYIHFLFTEQEIRKEEILCFHSTI